MTARATLLVAVLALCACKQRIDVLAPAVAAGNGANGAAGRGGGNSGNASVPDPDDVNTGAPDAAALEPRCDACGESELCAVDTCVGTRGITWLASSLDHSCRIADGRLYCWGWNEQGQLGLGDRETRRAPERVGSFNDWLRVSTGEHHSCALRAPGVLYCFGGNSEGQLASGDTAARLEPAEVATPVLLRELSCGGDSCCAIGAGGELFCWGDNIEGKIGQDDPYGSPDATEPQQVEPGTTWRAVGVGQGHVCAIKEAGALGCWGRNTDVELGIGDSPGQTRVPMRVGDASDWVSVAGSQHSSCGVRADGSLWCWGTNVNGELGLAQLDQKVNRPRQVGGDLDWAEVVTGWFHTCGLKRDGQLWCWGRAIEGQLARESVDPLPEPQPIGPPDRWRAVALGRMHSCALDDTGAQYCWGVNDQGQLGVGDDMRRYAPAPVP